MPPAGRWSCLEYGDEEEDLTLLHGRDGMGGARGGGILLSAMFTDRVALATDGGMLFYIQTRE